MGSCVVPANKTPQTNAMQQSILRNSSPRSQGSRVSPPPYSPLGPSVAPNSILLPNSSTPQLIPMAPMGPFPPIGPNNLMIPTQQNRGSLVTGVVPTNYPYPGSSTLYNRTLSPIPSVAENTTQFSSIRLQGQPDFATGPQTPQGMSPRHMNYQPRQSNAQFQPPNINTRSLSPMNVMRTSASRQTRMIHPPQLPMTINQTITTTTAPVSTGYAPVEQRSNYLMTQTIQRPPSQHLLVQPVAPPQVTFQPSIAPMTNEVMMRPPLNQLDTIDKSMLNMDPRMFNTNNPSPQLYTFAYGLEMPIMGQKYLRAKAY